MLKEETYNAKKRKIFAIAIIALIIGVILVATGDAPTRTSASDSSVSLAEYDLSRPSSSLEPEPSMSRHTYLIREMKALTNRVTTKGIMLSEYKKDFLNFTRRDYDIEGRYKDFALDCQRFSNEIGAALDEISSLRPADSESKAHQKEVVEKLIRLKRKVDSYKDYMRNPNQTVQFIEQCQHELRRVSDSVSLP